MACSPLTVLAFGDLVAPGVPNCPRSVPPAFCSPFCRGSIIRNRPPIGADRPQQGPQLLLGGEVALVLIWLVFSSTNQRGLWSTARRWRSEKTATLSQGFDCFHSVTSGLPACEHAPTRSDDVFHRRPRGGLHTSDAFVPLLGLVHASCEPCPVIATPSLLLSLTSAAARTTALGAPGMAAEGFADRGTSRAHRNG